MKKIFSILAIALLASCTVEKEEVKDCECNRVTSFVPLPYYKNYGFVWTVNDCTNETKRAYYDIILPVVGECR